MLYYGRILANLEDAEYVHIILERQTARTEMSPKGQGGVEMVTKLVNIQRSAGKDNAALVHATKTRSARMAAAIVASGIKGDKGSLKILQSSVNLEKLSCTVYDTLVLYMHEIHGQYKRGDKYISSFDLQRGRESF